MSRRRKQNQRKRESRERKDILTGEGDVEGSDPALREGGDQPVSAHWEDVSVCVCVWVCVSESSTVCDGWQTGAGRCFIYERLSVHASPVMGPLPSEVNV